MIGIIGKNGAGKTYIANQLYAKNFVRNVGYTTRQKRDGEVDGIDYYFITEEQFIELIKNDEFVDYKVRNGCYYGISKTKITQNTIIISGDSDKIEKATGFKLFKFYIDSDISTRYKRVKSRNDTMQNLFNRFHTENFSYLSDFNAIFINNDNSNQISQNRMLHLLNEKESELPSHLESNRVFIQKKVNDFDSRQLKQCDDKLLLILKYEEYFMRKMFLQHGNLDSLQQEKVREQYYNTMLKILSFNKINFSLSNDDLNVKIGNEEYNFDYKLMKR